MDALKAALALLCEGYDIVCGMIAHHPKTTFWIMVGAIVAWLVL